MNEVTSGYDCPFAGRGGAWLLVYLDGLDSVMFCQYLLPFSIPHLSICADIKQRVSGLIEENIGSSGLK